MRISVCVCLGFAPRGAALAAPLLRAGGRTRARDGDRARPRARILRGIRARSQDYKVGESLNPP